MLSVTTRLRPALLFSGLLLLVLAIEYLVIQRPDFAVRPALPAAVTFDLLVWPPLLFYLLVVRRYRLPVSLVGAVFAAMLALSQQMLPVGQQAYLHGAKYLLPIIEVATGALLLLKIRGLRQAYQQARASTPDVTANLAAACTAVFHRPFEALVFEAALWYHALLSWRAVPRYMAGGQSFSGHQQSGFSALLLTLAVLTVVEGAVAHLLLVRWSTQVALVALLLNAYTLIGAIGHLRAVQLGASVQLLASGELLLRAGLVWRVAVPLIQLRSVIRITDAPAPKANLLNMAKPLLAPANLLLTFNGPVTIAGPYGLRRTVQQITVYVDDPTACCAALLSVVSAASPKNL